MKIDIDEVEYLLVKNGIPNDKVVKIIDDATKAIEEQKEDKEKETPKLKFEYSIILSDPEKKIPAGEYTGWIVKFREGTNIAAIPEKLRKVAADYNANSRAGKKNPLKTFGELFQFCKAKFWKQEQVKNVTKEPVFVHIVDNQLSFKSNENLRSPA